jgi:putative transposase
MYDYRTMTSAARARVVEYRQKQKIPWHSPPHWEFTSGCFLVSAACYQHEPIIGVSIERMTECEREMLEACERLCIAVHAWCLLPNHYHVLVTTESISELSAELGRFHGRSSYRWNGEEERRGRHVWYRCQDRAIRSERHFWASVNYIHNNPVRHGYVEKWQDWPWSSAMEFLDSMGRDEAMRIWKEYPIRNYGKKWDL